MRRRQTPPARTAAGRNMAPDEHDDIGWFAESELPRLAVADPAAPQDLVRLMRAIE